MGPDFHVQQEMSQAEWLKSQLKGQRSLSLSPDFIYDEESLYVLVSNMFSYFWQGLLCQLSAFWKEFPLRNLLVGMLLEIMTQRKNTSINKPKSWPDNYGKPCQGQARQYIFT